MVRGRWAPCQGREALANRPGELERAARRHPESAGRGTIACFEQGRLSDAQPYFRIIGGTIAASPLGTYVTQTPDVILRRDASQVNLPQHLRDVRVFAWSSASAFSRS